MDPVSFTPYVFSDAGKVWNYGSGVPGQESGMSAGFGLRINATIGLSGNLGVAFPISRPVSVPIYGGSQRSPRLMFQVSQSF